MAYKLTIGDKFAFTMSLSVRDGDRDIPVRVTFVGRRLSVTEYGVESKKAVRDFLADNIVGWRDQRVVVGDDGQPAAYSREALEALFELPGAEDAAFRAYLDALAATNTAAGRTGN